jgi:CxxC motif-containing protein (DUF1111 family)
MPLLPRRSADHGPLALYRTEQRHLRAVQRFAFHDMGYGLADGISQGDANGSEFRTAPLWGVGQRIFFLHDGRTADLLQAICAHASPGSETNLVVGYFNMLPPQDQQAVLAFFRSP